MKIAIFIKPFCFMAFLFQSLIGSNENCNKELSGSLNIPKLFQSLIGSNENCNDMAEKEGRTTAVSIPNRE